MKFLSAYLMFLTATKAFAPNTPSTVPQARCSALFAVQSDNERAESHKFSLRAPMAGLVLGLALMANSVNAVELDFSLPTYDSKMAGFGEGTEAILSGKTSTSNPGGNEKTKESDAAMKAAIALKEKRLKDKEMQKLRYEEDKQRALEKKARDAERLKNIWSS